MRFFPGDKVRYIGKKYSNVLGMKQGEVMAEVRNQLSAVVVDFGDDVYICRSDSLMKLK